MFGPPQCLTTASTCSWLGQSVSGLRHATIRSIQTRFRFGFGTEYLNLATHRNSPARSTKSTTPHPKVLCLLVSIGFQVLFHSPPGVLFTFPSRYYTLSVMVLPLSHRIPRVLWYSGYTSPSRRFAYEALTLYGSTFQLYSTTTVRAKQCPYPALYFYMTVWALSLSLTTTQKIDSFLSLPPGTKMFQFPGFPSYTLCVQVSITQHYLR